jgi:hypothetical protein
VVVLKEKKIGCHQIQIMANKIKFIINFYVEWKTTRSQAIFVLETRNRTLFSFVQKQVGCSSNDFFASEEASRNFINNPEVWIPPNSRVPHHCIIWSISRMNCA